MKVTFVAHRGHVAVALWPDTRPMAGIVYMESVGLSADWKDRTYFLAGHYAHMMRKNGGHLIGRLP